ncbi:MAG: Dam family site-specific DNA-(adenine-N6)-methyltransferase [Proteobacteria bacterium]|nr:Dam family site-specific DNA-(adenine-N6)-methyltransferase [Pseudomonadota bacterium]NBP13599.1 Dam family site-specific DNA-(adenine-N6)-methyltransferase [bacterium]
MTKTLTPIIKWAGGKRQILPILKKHFPIEFGDYFEPFVGGGSVFMELYNGRLLDNKNVYLSDIMIPLINLYQVILRQPEALLEELSNEKYANNRDVYIEMRQSFNRLKQLASVVYHTNVEMAALFLYLNKTGFNGMYRENAKGEYNIAYGRNVSSKFGDKTTIMNLHSFLRMPNVTIGCGHYLDIEPLVKPGDFVYLDPPYYGTFTGYNNEKFGEGEQIRLRDYFMLLTQRGVKVALSNSDCQFIRELYKTIPGVRVIEIPVKRFINSKVTERNKLCTELLIVNYTNN